MIDTRPSIGTGRDRLSPCPRYCWRILPLSERSGSAIFEALFQPQTDQAGPAGIATLLESPYRLPPDCLPTQAQAIARYSICAGAPRLVHGQYQLWTPELGKILPFLQRLIQVAPPLADSAEAQPPPHLPFLGGYLGWLGYDLAWEIERLPKLKEDYLPFPVAYWYEPAAFAVVDHHTQQLWLAAEDIDMLNHLAVLSQNAIPGDCVVDYNHFSSIYIEEKYIDKNQNSKNKSGAVDIADFTDQLDFETDQATFEQAVRQAKAHITAGDVFQVNHSLRFRAQTTTGSWQIYKRLHGINPSPFASYWHTPWGMVVSCSPERLVHLAAGIAGSRPIAGTRPRGESAIADEANAQTLVSDPKEKAEHIMLVDLERNDLGRVCEWGSVRVDELMTIERYSHVMHLVSNVVGKLRLDASPADLIAALFPGGTITGCPKVRCMEIIETLEPVRRSLFYGSCGYLDRRGRLDLNILIRTLLISNEISDSLSDSASRSTGKIQEDAMTVWGQVGAGIVADSDPEREWQESLQKARAQLLALGL
ncbi:MAG: chorismate-binding protein [Cyanobacteria bacterium J06634_6]